MACETLKGLVNLKSHQLLTLMFFQTCGENDQRFTFSVLYYISHEVTMSY